jgi:hypothetical protein
MRVDDEMWYCQRSKISWEVVRIRDEGRDIDTLSRENLLVLIVVDLLMMNSLIRFSLHIDFASRRKAF